MAALIAASSGAYFYLSVQATRTIATKAAVGLPESTVAPGMEEDQHKVLPDAKLMARIAKIGRRFIPH